MMVVIYQYDKTHKNSSAKFVILQYKPIITHKPYPKWKIVNFRKPLARG